MRKNHKNKHLAHFNLSKQAKIWFGLSTNPNEFWGNPYSHEQNYVHQSRVRLRGKLWYQLLTFSLYVIVGLFLALLVGTFAKCLWYLLRSGLGNLVFNWFDIYFQPTFSWSYFRDFIAFSMAGGVLQDTSFITWGLMEVIFALILRLGIRNWYDWVQKFSDRTVDYNRFASLKEIDQTYQLVPDRNQFYNAQAGMPVSHISGYSWPFFKLHPFLAIKQWLKGFLGINREHWGKRTQALYQCLVKSPHLEKMLGRQLSVTGGYAGYYYIDDTPTHEVIIGATRAGKDQLLGYILIDLLRRGENPPNIIDTDAENEDGKMSFKALERAGFEVQLLNIADTDWSETWNPFQVALDYALDGELDKARDEAMVVVQIIGASKDSNAENGVWDDTAEATQLAIVLILIWLAIEHNDPTLATPTGVPQFINSVNQFNDPQDKNLDGLTKYFQMLQKLDPMPPIVNEAILKAGSYLGSTGDTKSSIMFTLQSRISLFASETVARLTSRSTIKMTDYGFPRMFKATLPLAYAGATAKVELHDLTKTKGIITPDYLEQDAVKVSRSGVITYPFQQLFPVSWAIHIQFNDTSNPIHLRETSLTIFGEKRVKRNLDGTIKLDKNSRLPIEKLVVKQKRFNLFEQKTATFSLRYSEKPIAMFLVTPQNNDNYAALASLFLGQVFSINTQIASNITRRQMDQRIFYKLNEFSMFPRIPGFDNFLTRGLTYGHIVIMYVQDEAQIGKHYNNEEVSEIKNNMLNTVLIQTKDAETNKSISDSLGEIEVQKEIVNSQMGTQQQDRGNRQMSIEKMPLRSPKELQEMTSREMIMLRQAKRLDKKGHRVRPLPIFNTQATLMPNTRDLIGESFRLDYYTTDLRIKNHTKHLTYEDMFQDFTPYYEELAQQVQGNEGLTVQDSRLNFDEMKQLADKLTANDDAQTNGEREYQASFETWQDDFEAKRRAKTPVLTPEQLINPNEIRLIEDVIGNFISQIHYTKRTALQTNALVLAKNHRLFETMPELNDWDQLLYLFENNYSQLYELTKLMSNKTAEQSPANDNEDL